MFNFFDLHCDTITQTFNKENLFNNNLHIDLKRLENFKCAVQFFAIWLDKKYINNPFKNTLDIIDYFDNEINKYSRVISKALSYSDIIKNIEQKTISGILSIEGGEALEGKIENLFKFYNCGIRMLTLTWNNENCIGYGIKSNEKKGLKTFGIEVIKEMNKINMIIDVSHLNESGFWDVVNISTKPFAASHSNVYKICKNDRNLKDDQIKAIALKNGIIGINLYPWFLNEDGKSDIYTVIKHIDYIINMIGDDYISMGCDFDGINILPKEITGIESIHKIYEIIFNEYGKKTADKIMFENALNFIKNTL